jgi:hypothetical protein
MLEGENMNQNIKPVTPRCGICKKLYSSEDDDGSGVSEFKELWNNASTSSEKNNV